MFGMKQTLRMTAQVFAEIERTVGSLPAEQGGILGGNPNEGVISHYHFDAEGSRTGVTYSPNAKLLTELLQKEWNPRGIRLMGFVHSHPRSFRRLSSGDIFYAERILGVNEEMAALYLPLVMSAGDAGRFEFLPFAVVPGEGGKPRVQSMNLRIVSGSAHRPLDGVDAVPAIFERVRGAYDLDWLAGCRVIAIGAGGANSWLDNMARTGVGEFVLVDPDTVEAKNVGTQRVYLSEAGKPKVQVVCQRLLDINPEVKVLPLPALLDRIDDKMFARLALAPWDQLDNSDRKSVV